MKSKGSASVKKARDICPGELRKADVSNTVQGSNCYDSFTLGAFDDSALTRVVSFEREGANRE